MEQLDLFGGSKPIEDERKHRNLIPSYKKNDSINIYIQKMNTLKHVYRLQSLCKIYNRLFLLTQNKKLACLNYFIEDDGEMYAEIDGTQRLEIKDRVIEHLNLLRRIKNNEIQPQEYDEYKHVTSDTISLFG